MRAAAVYLWAGSTVLGGSRSAGLPVGEQGEDQRERDPAQLENVMCVCNTVTSPLPLRVISYE